LEKQALDRGARVPGEGMRKKAFEAKAEADEIAKRRIKREKYHTNAGGVS
jgi:hypothetical protein